MRRQALAILSTALLFALPTLAVDLFVSPVGRDTNPGTRAKPFATLERARDEIRRFTRAGNLPKGGVTVWLRGGDYLRANTLELTAADSGTRKRPSSGALARERLFVCWAE